MRVQVWMQDKKVVFIISMGIKVWMQDKKVVLTILQDKSWDVRQESRVYYQYSCKSLVGCETGKFYFNTTHRK